MGETTPTRLRSKGVRIGLSFAFLLVSAGLLTYAIAGSVASVAASPAAQVVPNEEEKDALISVLGHEIERDRVAIPSDWGETLTKSLFVQTAYDGADILFRIRFPSARPGFLHDVLRYEGGNWVKYGSSEVGSVQYDLYEDRLTFHVDDGSVQGFRAQGCSAACHSDLRYPFMYAAPQKDAVSANSYFANVMEKTDTRHYLPDSRDPGEDWWDVSWDAIDEGDAARTEALKEAGVILDQWHWRAARGAPIGVSDDMWVLDYRNGDEGTSAYSGNVDADTGLPKNMFDPEKAGYRALRWDDVVAGRLSQDQAYYLGPDTMTAFDPDHAWQEGDVIPARYLRMPEGSRADITSQSRWDDGWWTVELRRKMDTGNLDDKPFFEYRTYNIAFAFYTRGTGNRFHYVTFPKSLALGRPGDVEAARFSGDAPDWNGIPVAEFTAFYPGQSSWQFLTSDEHPGAPAVRANNRSCATCHTEEQVARLGVGLELRSEREAGRAATWIAGLVGILGIAGAGVVLRRG